MLVRSSALALCLASCAATPAPEPQEGFRWFERGLYAGGTLGPAIADASAADLDAALATQGFTTSSTVDDQDLGWKVFAGYRFELPLAVEVAYTELGTLDTRVSAAAPVDVDALLGALTDTQPYLGNGVALALVFYPVRTDRFAAGVKGGLWFWEADVEATATTGERASVRENDVDPLFGVHALLDLTDRVALRAEYERYYLNGDGVDFLSAGLQFRLL